GTSAEFGNMVLYGKLLLWEERHYAIGAGVGVTMPTADDVVLRDANGTDIVRVENESPHLMPYLGLVCTPDRQLFWQTMVQFDIDTQGNGVSVSPFENGAYTGNLQFADRLRDKDLVYVDFSIGYWLYQGRRSSRFISGLAPIFEVHYNGAVNRGDALVTDAIRAPASASFDLVNAVAGAVVQFGGNVNMNLAYVTPIGGDEQFDGEFRMSLNWFFGPSAQSYARYPF
ncbi:MAG: hypothetical protein AAF961_19545, partial [Planctomycetota bacterium]